MSGDLPSTRMKAITDAVIASSPKVERPRMSTENEEKLYDSDRMRAASYAAIEDATSQLKDLVQEIEDNASGGIPVFIDDADENSLITSIESLRQSANAG